MSFTLHALARIDGGETDGMHLLWPPPYPSGHAIDGFTIRRRDSGQDREQVCFTIGEGDLDRARRQGLVRLPDAAVWAMPKDRETPGSEVWTYRIALRRRHRVVEIAGAGAVAGFAAREDGQVIDAGSFAADRCTLRGDGIAIVWLVVQKPGSDFRLCGDLEAEGAWDHARVLVSGLQMPFQAADPGLGSIDDEKARAIDLALPEPLDGGFEDLSRYANLTLARPFDLPAWRLQANDRTAENTRWDSAAFAMVAALGAVSPAWRRGLGLGFLDRVDLTPGQAYDYRISGLVRRADRDERRSDFHTVPRGYRLPRYFRLGELTLVALPGAVVEAMEAPDASGLIGLSKGIKCDLLRLFLPRPTRWIVLSGRSDDPADLEGFLDGSPVAGLSATLDLRTEIDFGTPVDEITLKYRGLVFAIVPEPLDPALDPAEPVEIAATCHGAVFAPGPPVPPPANLAVENLGSAARTLARDHRDAAKGFALAWDAPPAIDPALLPFWPVDATAAPPSLIAGYRIERSFDGGPVAAAEGSGGLHIPGRNADPVTEAPAPGADLLRVFPPADRPGLARDWRVRATEVFEGAAPAFGTGVGYRVASLDAIGRQSIPVTAPPERLEKSTRPPVPIGPPPGPAGDLPLLANPGGIRVRLLQRGDPRLSAADRARIEAEGELVLVEWGWGPNERRVDPFVTEFRLYEAAGRLAEIAARVTGPALPRAGGGWGLPVSLSRAAGASEFAGRKITLGAAFPIRSHPAGTSITLELGPSPVDAAIVPAGAEFTLIRRSGAEAEPDYWDSRAAVVPRVPIPGDPDAIERYEAALPAGWIAVDAATPRQVRAIGVSAADAETYVPDPRASVEPAPRPGNEGLVAGREVVAHFRGRPVLTIADLGPVAERLAARAVADDVQVTFTPADHLPAGGVTVPRMRIERCHESAVLPRIAVTPGGIALRDRDGTTRPWPLSPADEAQIRAEDAARDISNRFLVHAAARLTDLAPDFERIAEADPARPLRDTAPNRTGRWLYRLRAIDAAGHLSAAGQVLELAVRMPTPKRGTLPELVSLRIEAGTATVRLRDRSRGADALFLATSADPRLGVARAELSTVRNRPDLTPEARLFIRDDKGRSLALTAVAAAADGFAEQDFPVPDNTRFHVWALSVGADGVPSRLIGPLHGARGLPPELS